MMVISLLALRSVLPQSPILIHHAGQFRAVSHAHRVGLRRFATASPGSSPPVIWIEDGTFYREFPSPGVPAETNPPLYPRLSFTLPSAPVPVIQGDESPGSAGVRALQHWAVVGAGGKAVFLEILRGKHICLPPGARSFPYLLTDEVGQRDGRLRFPGHAIQHVGFGGEMKAQFGGVRGSYLSARYESRREETDFSVLQFLRGQMELNPFEEGGRNKKIDEALLQAVIYDLNLGKLLDMPVANLSNGQTRRARIAKALLGRPEVLLLDEPFMGLDPHTVKTLSPLLYKLAQRCAPRLVLSLRPQDPIPDWITHLVFLGDNHTVALQGARHDVFETLDIWKRVAFGAPVTPSSPTAHAKYEHAVALKNSGQLDAHVGLLREIRAMATPNVITGTGARRPATTGKPVVEMDGVQVRYGDKCVLGDWSEQVPSSADGSSTATRHGLHWTVRQGERWGVFGANGSGKTTLISLLTSDHPQAYSQPVRLFGRGRLPAPGRPAFTIFDLQARIGHVSPELHAFFPRHLSVRQAVQSAFADTFLSRPRMNEERRMDVDAALRFFADELRPEARSASGSATGDDLAWADATPFSELSMPHQRTVLLLRALIARPPLVVLDEAFAGMPPALRDKCLRFLEVGELNPETDSEIAVGHSQTQKKGNIRHTGLNDEQAMIVVSHVREEVPGMVSRWIVLPSLETGEETRSRDTAGRLVCRRGELASGRTVAGDGWEEIWGIRED